MIVNNWSFLVLGTISKKLNLPALCQGALGDMLNDLDGFLDLEKILSQLVLTTWAVIAHVLSRGLPS